MRPEVKALLLRWREVALALAGAAFGLWVATRGGWFYAVLGAALLAFALGLALSAWRRMRFAQEDVAPGLVEVDEGAMHGWTGPDSAVYHEAQAERAWNRLLALLNGALTG